MSKKYIRSIIFLIIGLILAIYIFDKKALANISKKEIKRAEVKQANLERYLSVEAALLGVNDNISLYFKDIDKEISIDSTRSWIPASTIKAFVLLETFRQRRVGLIDFDRQIVINAENVVPTELETDEFPILREGIRASIKQLVEAMIIQSDNTAYNTMLDILDRRNINPTLRSFGITETVVGEKLNLDDTQFQNDLAVLGRQPNTTTVKDLAFLFDLLYNKQVSDADEMLSIFKRQKINNMIPVFLPEKTIVAHKTGSWPPLYHDGGVIFKPKDPFILAIFTNSNDPSVLAKMAQVAYYQNTDSVGQAALLDKKESKNALRKYQSRIYLTRIPSESQVLGVSANKIETKTYTVQKGDSLWSISEKFYNTGIRWENIARRNYLQNPTRIDTGIKLVIPPLQLNKPEGNSEKFPKITASDLGITIKDVNVGKEEAKRVKNAKITPSSPLYFIKRLIEGLQLITAPRNQKISLYLVFSKNRLTEIKTLLQEGDSSKIEQLLSESEDNLNKATAIVAKNSKTSDLQLLEIKQMSDLHFAILAESASKLSTKNKEKFVDAVYNFYQRNQREVAPVVKASSIVNPLAQQPLIGTIADIKDNIITLRFDNGTTRKIIAGNATRVRDFHKKNLDNINSLVVGSKIAVVVNNTKEGKTFPIFILKNIPKELPDEHEGVVLEIDPQKNTLKIQNQKGQKENIKVDEETVVKAKDTGVALEGIKAGSQVTIFGEVRKNATPQTQSTQNQESQSSVQKEVSHESEIKATSITVTKNSSGAQEKIETTPKKEEIKQPANNPSTKSKETEKKDTKKEDDKPTKASDK